MGLYFRAIRVMYVIGPIDNIIFWKLNNYNSDKLILTCYIFYWSVKNNVLYYILIIN